MKPRDLDDKAAFIAHRREYLAKHAGLVKRAPDEPVITSTLEDTAVWPTTTSTILAPTQSMVVTRVNYITSTVTPTPVTVINGKTTVAEVVVTLPTTTKTVNQWTIAWDVQTQIYTYT